MLHHQFIPGIQLTQSSGIRSATALRWTWAKTKTSANQRYRRRWRELLAIQIHSGKCLWFISAADGRGHCALFKHFLSTKILRPDGVAAPIVLCYSRFTQEAHQPKNCGVVHTRSGRTMAGGVGQAGVHGWFVSLVQDTRLSLTWIGFWDRSWQVQLLTDPVAGGCLTCVDLHCSARAYGAQSSASYCLFFFPAWTQGAR